MHAEEKRKFVIFEVAQIIFGNFNPGFFYFCIVEVGTNMVGTLKKII
jgi:hypothetical protein